VVKARDGDSKAMEELYRLYVKAMYHHCICITGNKDDAEDVLQDSFIYAFDHLHEVMNANAFGGWLRRIVVATAIRFSKKRVSWSDVNEQHDQCKKEDDDPWWLNISMEAAHEAVKNLPNGCRQIFVLYVFEDFPHKEIAATLGISESTSKSQYQRARQLLKERLAKQKEAYG
jgi:RNA polymerase sigma factor (sigma-70 family)